MENGSRLTMRLAIIGTALLASVFAPVFLFTPAWVHPKSAAAYLAIAGMESSPVALLGGSLLLLAAVRSRSRRMVVGLGLAAALASVVAVYGRAIPVGWSFVASLVTTYWLGIAVVALGGASLARTLVLKARAADSVVAGRG